MHAHESLIKRFFASLRLRDAEAIAACYAPDAEYSSLVLGRVVGARVPAFWRMVCARGNLEELVVEKVDADDYRGLARWAATYACGPQRVHHVTESTFRFEDGKIVRQHDRLEACPNSRTIGSQQLASDESSPLVTALRARGLIALDAFVRHQVRPAQVIRYNERPRPVRMQSAPRMMMSLSLEPPVARSRAR